MYCIYCAVSLPEDAVFCSRCGKALRSEEPSPAPDKPGPKQPGEQPAEHGHTSR